LKSERDIDLKVTFNSKIKKTEQALIKQAAIFIFSLVSIFSLTTTQAQEFDLRHTYITVWTVDTDDKGLFDLHIADHASEVLKLWQKGLVENIYIDREAAENQEFNKTKTVFFIKAENENEAKKYLDVLPFITKKVASYELYPVGFLWLKQF